MARSAGICGAGQRRQIADDRNRHHQDSPEYHLHDFIAFLHIGSFIFSGPIYGPVLNFRQFADKIQPGTDERPSGSPD